MNSRYLTMVSLPVLGLLMALPVWNAGAQTVTTRWIGDAARIYDTGFMLQLMKAPPGGVQLFNRELVENDAPGAGLSEKGVWQDPIWGKNRARKEIVLDDPRARKAWLVVYVTRQGKHPLSFTVNSRLSRIDNWDERANPEFCRWSEFPAEWLKKGNNTIDLFCPQAASEQEGWTIQLARADEFEAGGGDPKDVGKTSFQSVNGGESWKESPFGPLGQDRCEYTVRLSLDRYVRTGWLETPVIDLWRGDSPDFIVPIRMLRKLAVSASAEVPEGTKVEYYMRKGTAPGPYSEEWSPYEFAGSGPALDLTVNVAAFNRRYLQLRMVLSTTNPLISPALKFLRVEAEHQENIPLWENIHVLTVENPPVRYSSIPWEWESWDRPEFARLRERQNLDTVVAGSTTEFDAQVKLMNHAIRQWIDGGVTPEYPNWDALSILDQINKTGGGGMCLQNNLLLAGFCQCYGWQARHVNVVSHEICEVWNDEYAKWIYLDSHRANHYFFDHKTAEPLSVLDIHRAYLDKYFPDRPIDWMKDTFSFPPDDHPYADRGSPTGHGGINFNEYCRPAFVRMVPRANWFSKPFPRPLNHGLTQWPWNGYINWYDDRTPPKRQYSRFTDRERDMWPDLNTVHIDAVSSYGNDCLYLRFETFTPNLSHFEVDVNDTGWKKVGEQWVWLLQSGKNTLRARAVNKRGVKGKPSVVVLNHADVPFDSYRRR
jgi:hypothetical protein